MVDDQFSWGERIDLVGVAAQGFHGIAHGGQIDHAGHAGEILQHHTRRREGDFGVWLGLGIPVQERIDIGAGDIDAVLGAKQVFKEDFQGIGQLGQFVAGYGVKAVDVVATISHLQAGACIIAVGHH